MANVTYYAVPPFVRDEDGNLGPDEAVECQSPSGAATKARALVPVKAGAVAFSRTGDPETGEWATPWCWREPVIRRPIWRWSAAKTVDAVLTGLCRNARMVDKPKKPARSRERVVDTGDALRGPDTTGSFVRQPMSELALV